MREPLPKASFDVPDGGDDLGLRMPERVDGNRLAGLAETDCSLEAGGRSGARETALRSSTPIEANANATGRRGSCGPGSRAIPSRGRLDTTVGRDRAR